MDPRLKQTAYFLRACLFRGLPSEVQTLDPHRMTIAYFSVAGLSLLGVLDRLAAENPRLKPLMIEWIYRQQAASGLFHPGPFLGTNSTISSTAAGASPSEQPIVHSEVDLSRLPFYEFGHIAMTYTALANLRMLGDDLSRIPRARLVHSLSQFQLPHGGFCAYGPGSETDVRFVYCACAIADMLGDWRFVNVDAAVGFLRRCHRYDGGFAQAPDLESHGGSTYCAVASLHLMGQLDSFFGSEADRQRTVVWLLNRQSAEEGGFCGRPYKAPDTCYTFWIGASLRMLCAGILEDMKCATDANESASAASHASLFPLLDLSAIRRFIWTAWDDDHGGFAKAPDLAEDVLHTYFSLCGLGWCHEPGVGLYDPALGFPLSAES
eukprot:ANDGO_03539.mRNA.1 Geranylgeranyl transferase type-1 subunit beta